MKKIICILLGLSLAIVACKKKKDEKTAENNFVYNGLTSDHDTILKGNITTIKANVTGGTNLTYNWSASAGDIFGSGSSITFGASTCCTGSHTITCVVSDKSNHSGSKTVTVQVK